jgi:hypothetical protein
MLGWLAIGLLAGCEKDEINHYRVPREQVVETRLLAAIVPQHKSTWFFKLVGPMSAVQEHQEAFDRFLQSVRFTDQIDQPIKWTVPESWQQVQAGENRYASFALRGKDDAELEMTVTRLGPEAAAVQPNVDRWRRQMGLPPLAPQDLGTVCKEIKIDGLIATRVDMATTKKAPARSPLTYSRPESWRELPPSAKAMPGISVVAAFQVSEGEQMAEVTITQLAGEAGGVLANVNRWRSQIGLDPVTEEELRKDLQVTEIAGARGVLIDLLGPEKADRQRILAAISTQGDRSWFFKLKGPAELVGKQKTNFVTFIGSVRFDGGPGGIHE